MDGKERIERFRVSGISELDEESNESLQSYADQNPIGMLLVLSERLDGVAKKFTSNLLTGVLPKGSVIGCLTCEQPWCCNQLMTVGPVDVGLAAKYLHESGRNTRAFREKLKTIGLEQEAAGQALWWARREPCTFLVSGRCEIYDVRPQCCRAYYSSSPAEKCNPNHAGADGTVKFYDTASVFDVMVLCNRIFTSFMGTREGWAAVRAMPYQLSVILRAISDPDNATDIIRKGVVMSPKEARRALIKGCGGRCDASR